MKCICIEKKEVKLLFLRTAGYYRTGVKIETVRLSSIIKRLDCLIVKPNPQVTPRTNISVVKKAENFNYMVVPPMRSPQKVYKANIEMKCKGLLRAGMRPAG